MTARPRRTGQGQTSTPQASPPPPPPPYMYVEDTANCARRWTAPNPPAGNHNLQCNHTPAALPLPPPMVVMPPTQAQQRAAFASAPVPQKQNPLSPPQQPMRDMAVAATPTTIFGGRFTLLERIGSGGFGDVFRAEEQGQGSPLAVKVEQVTEANSRPEQSFLFHEAKVLQDIHKSIQAHSAKLKAEREARLLNGGAAREDGEEASPELNPDTVGITRLKYYGQDNTQRVLIMSLHGHSVENVHRRQGRLSLFATLMIADQVLSSLEHVHRAGYVHADLKPDNILFGRKNPEQLYLVDFGLSVRYRDREGKHRPLVTNHSFVGTPRYASLRTHMGYTLSRRDDIEQLVYVMIYLFRGRLPWSGLRIDDPDEKEKHIATMKANTPLDTICAGCPEAFRDVLNYARCMEFEEEPQYEYLHLLLFSLREACAMGSAGEAVCTPAPPVIKEQQPTALPQPQRHVQQPQQPVQANINVCQGVGKQVERVSDGGRQASSAKDPNIVSGGGNEVEGGDANPLLSGQEGGAPAFFSDAIGQGILSGNATDAAPLSPRIDCLNDGHSPTCLPLGAALVSPAGTPRP